MAHAQIGLIGLGVMGENLALNMLNHGYRVAVLNRTVSKVDDFVRGPAKGKNVIGCQALEELCRQLEKPRKVCRALLGRCMTSRSHFAVIP